MLKEQNTHLVTLVVISTFLQKTQWVSFLLRKLLIGTTRKYNQIRRSWSVGLVVVGGDLCTRRREFEFQRRVLDG